MLLNELSCDVLEAVVRNLSPSDVGSLVSTCKALQASATPRLVDWAWLREHVEEFGGRWSVCRKAAEEGRLQALRWARALGCPWNSRVCGSAARGGYLQVLQLARAKTPPCPWNEDTCSAAAHGGHLHLLQWAREQSPPCPWGSLTCSEAASHGYLAVLQFARGQAPPCPWCKRTCGNAVRGVHRDVLQWARAHGCPWDKEECLKALRGEVDDVNYSNEGEHLRELRDAGDPDYVALLSWVEAEAA